MIPDGMDKKEKSKNMDDWFLYCKRRKVRVSCEKEDETRKQEILKKQLLTRLFIFAAESD